MGQNVSNVMLPGKDDELSGIEAKVGLDLYGLATVLNMASHWDLNQGHKDGKHQPHQIQFAY